MKRRNKFLLWGFFSDVVLLDQASKYFAEVYLKHRDFPLNSWFSLTLSHNTGCAWSLFQGRTMILGFLGIAVLLLIYYLRNILGIYERPIAFGLLLGGILGNAIDRLCRGLVVDFFNVNLSIYNWPIFNVADAALCMAVFILVFFRPMGRKSKNLNDKELDE